MSTALWAMTTQLRQQVLRDLPMAAEKVPVLYLPGASPLMISPLDFGHTQQLMLEAYRESRAFLETASVSGAGLYQSRPDPDVMPVVAPPSQQMTSGSQAPVRFPLERGDDPNRSDPETGESPATAGDSLEHPQRDSNPCRHLERELAGAPIRRLRSHPSDIGNRRLACCRADRVGGA